MAWMLQDQVPPGKFVMATVIDGFAVDIFPVSDAEIIERIRSYAQGWAPSVIYRKRGLFGVGDVFRVFGQAGPQAIPSEIVRGQVSAALNSFLTIGGVDVSVSVSDSLSTPVPDDSGEFNTTLQLIAIAAIVIGVVWGLKQLREISQ